MDASSTLAFLDLSWPGSLPQRVFIRLSPNTARGRQFVLLCTAELGPSYANTSAIGVVNKGKPGESLWGGDYDKSGGAAIVPGITRDGDYTRPVMAGAVSGTWYDDKVKNARYGARFCIAVRDKPGHEWPTVFGQVESGLEVVTSAAKLLSISNITVVDCGIVLTN